MKARLFAGVFLLVLAAFGISSETDVSAQTAPRTLQVVSSTGCAGFVTTVPIAFQAVGNEVGLSFTLEFDPTILTNPTVSLGADAAARGFVLTVNSNQVATGRLGILLDSSLPFLASPPLRQVVNVQFQVVAGAPAGTTPLNFVGFPPIGLSTSDDEGQLLPTNYVGGNVNIGGPSCTTAASVSVSGRVLTSSGTGLRNASVVITDAQGNRRSVLTSSLGYYMFEEIEAGGTYVVTVSSKRYRFASKVLQVADNLTDVDFIGQE